VTSLATQSARDDVRVVQLPAPIGAVATLMEHEHAVFAWEPRDGGEAWAGIGIAHELRASGARRFEQIARAASALWARVSIPSAPEGATPGPLAGARGSAFGLGPAPRGASIAPRMFGGFAFAPGAASAPPWSDFGDAWFVLPRWSYVRRGDQAWWLFVGERDPDRMPEERAELERLLARGPSTHASTIVDRDDGDRDAWCAHVEEIRAAIGAGAVAKVVAARPCTIELSAAASPAAVLARLGAAHPECTRYVFRSKSAAFAGATPERLIRRRGSAVDGEALAGSIARSAEDGPAKLLASAKDRGEHELVVRAVTDGLARFCAKLDAPSEPRVRALRHIHHLHTPITGELAVPAHVLELAAALHPTPAVGGTPTAAALEWIASREPAPRGWYAAPVGWFDAGGDGELVVAIRSGLLAGRRAHVWAGAGIVRDSDAEAEWDEVALKQRALLGALGEP